MLALSLHGGTMRLGAQPCRLKANTIAFRCYGRELISERHRHRYEFNNKYKDIFASKGFIFSGFTSDGELAEIIELKDHPWFVAVQFHPEFKSKPTNPHPLFKEFIKATLDIKRGQSKGVKSFHDYIGPKGVKSFHDYIYA